MAVVGLCRKSQLACQLWWTNRTVYQHSIPSGLDVYVQDNGPSVGFAIAGGVLLFCGNLGTQYALAFTGLSITEVVASSLTVVGGTTINYCEYEAINPVSGTLKIPHETLKPSEVSG